VGSVAHPKACEGKSQNNFSLFSEQSYKKYILNSRKSSLFLVIFFDPSASVACPASRWHSDSVARLVCLSRSFPSPCPVNALVEVWDYVVCLE
jgi:hypothetical protein